MHEAWGWAGMGAAFLAAAAAAGRAVRLRELKGTAEGEPMYEDMQVYRAAARFAEGASRAEMAALLNGSYQFDRLRIEETLRRALPGRADADGGYGAFIRAVNRTLGEEVYRSRS
ncbi:hypothetical protein F4V43_03480 [Paenibacillus spiritus]|uniref:Uncharacterized protein n=1 Tax=Paenibacillus spiritus TaxID=2496557 RepID=A0A5J5GIL7_9BACL|nr:MULTISPECIES: hypothetical protein [Paenibacillus]KAA9007563.1 hypothetical protein F4V43_03480 [Paenibacillus spiritus]